MLLNKYIICIDADGKLVDEVQDKYIWLKELVCEGDKNLILIIDIPPNITLPLSSAVLVDFVSQIQRYLKHKIIYPSPPGYCSICRVLPL